MLVGAQASVEVDLSAVETREHSIEAAGQMLKLVVVRPALGLLQGRGEVAAPVYRHAEAEFNIDAGQRREYLRVRRVPLRPGDLPSQPMRIELAPSQNSGVLTSCQWADALVVMEPGQKIREGDWVKYLPMDYLMLAP